MHSLGIRHAYWFSGLGLFGFTQEKFDLVEQCREKIFLLETRRHVLSPVHRAVAGHNNYRSTWTLLSDSVRKFDTVHSFHAEIRDENVEILLIEFLQRFLCTVSAYGFVALHLEDFAAQAS